MEKLPEEIIEHIQSLISDQIEAARTSLLSKSWHRLWCTPPNLRFYQCTSRNRVDEFSIFAMKTMQRYEDLNRNIKSFKLWMHVVGNNDSDLARELILKAIKLGATDLTLEFPKSYTNRCFVLPDEVLESKTLVRLSVFGLMIDLKRRNKAVACSNLKYLWLSHASVKGDLIRDLISRCPSIEELTLRDPRSSCPLSFDTMIKLHKLKYLLLEALDLNDSLANYDLWPQLACLKELVIEDYRSDYDLRICSPSLERITIHTTRFRVVINAEFDVPNIRYFKFKGCDVPRLKFKAMGSREWKSDIHILATDYVASASWLSSWLSSLKQLVKMLSPSRVSLSVFMGNVQDDVYGYVGDGLAIPVVENLVLGAFVMSRAFVDALLWCCRPNFIHVQRCDAEVVDLEVFRQLKEKKTTLLDHPKLLLRFQRK